MLNKKLADPDLPEHERKKIQNALYAIKIQAKNPIIDRLRRDLDAAQRAGDKDKAERLIREAQKIDRDFTN